MKLQHAVSIDIADVLKWTLIEPWTLNLPIQFSYICIHTTIRHTCTRSFEEKNFVSNTHSGKKHQSTDVFHMVKLFVERIQIFESNSLALNFSDEMKLKSNENQFKYTNRKISLQSRAYKSSRKRGRRPFLENIGTALSNINLNRTFPRMSYSKLYYKWPICYWN